jgi:hypothetical protein
MAKIGLGMQIVILFFILFLIISVISSYMLIRIKKTEYKSLWEADKKRATFWMTPEKFVLYETARGKPQWLKESEKAKFWLKIYRLSFLTAMMFLGLPFILALFGIYLFD